MPSHCAGCTGHVHTRIDVPAFVQVEYGPPCEGIALPPEVAKAMKAAVSALRSYQYGNASPDLAREIADVLEQALATGQEGQP